ncbi:hypothetical protein ACH4TX_12610 [Streptomyces sp. NPDC021098]|uniref:hypothetical protein n=1 Tax=unclassified Streptomyces TaxID=2593676 RepID=UPI00378EDEBB
MRGRLVIAAGVLAMALTPGVAWAADGGYQATGDHGAKTSASHGYSHHGKHEHGKQGHHGKHGKSGHGKPGKHGHGHHGKPGKHGYGHHGKPGHSQQGKGVPGYQVVTLPNKNVPNFERRTVNCPKGKKVIGGGAEARGNTAILVGSFPTDDHKGWIGLGRQTDADNVGISVFAICANV